MEISDLNIGIIHSLVGKNDGVSIVIDQSVRAMVEHMNVPLGNIFFLAAHAPSRFNTMLDEVFWHKNDANKHILRHFSARPPPGLERFIDEHAARAESVIDQFVSRYGIDLLIAHNTSHPYNFVAAVGLGRYLEKRRRNGVIVPRCLVWWHDSHYERAQFAAPNDVVARYLRYLPGRFIDGIVFINSTQPGYARGHLEIEGHDADTFFARKTAVIPNTCDITWDWRGQGCPADRPIFPPQDQYNRTFLADCGLLDALREKGVGLSDALILLQHTRIVPRKRIDVAIDFAIRLAERFRSAGSKRCVALLVSGHSGDEQDEYRASLEQYFRDETARRSNPRVILVMAEHIVFPHREIIVDRKFYSFQDIPSIVASCGGLGVYFSEVEGFGNNLLEMVGMGLPVVINRFDVYRSDIEPCGFKFPAIENCRLTEEFVDQSVRLLTDLKYQNECVRHNLQVLEDKFSHAVLAAKLKPLIRNLYTYQ